MTACRRLAASCATALLLAASGVARAETLRAGPGQPYAVPSAAIAAASAGDTVLIAPGEYFDCAVVARDGLVIEGDGPGVVLTDKTCQGKAILVTTGRDITIRDIELTRARAPDRNGAGIRAEGPDLTVERTRFIDNENGILAGDDPTSTIRISDSEFVGNGRCIRACAHGVYVGHIGLLRIEHTRFFRTIQGHHIKSRAARTELTGNEIADGPDGTSSYLVELPDGGDLLMRANALEKGPRTSNPRTAIMLGSERRGPPDASQVIIANRFVNDTGAMPVFVLNWGAASPVVSRNTLPDGIDALSTNGAFLQRLRGMLYAAKVYVTDMIGLARRVANKLLSMM
jgi:hypothetical protein